MTLNRTPDTREEATAKIPALHMLMTMGYNYLSPSQALSLRGSDQVVLLETVLRERLKRYRFDHRGKQYSLSEGGVDEVIRTLSLTGLTEGLIPANKAMTAHITQGITVTEFVGGEKTSKTVPLIDWANISSNVFHVTEEFSVQRPAGLGSFRPDIVVFVNGIPLAVIEAKRPVSTTRAKAMIDEGISQHLRNQQGDGIQDLYAYSQLLLSISGSEGRYGTTGTAKKFWAIWREEELAAAELSRLRNQPLTEAQKGLLFADRPAYAFTNYMHLHASAVTVTEQDGRVPAVGVRGRARSPGVA